MPYYRCRSCDLIFFKQVSRADNIKLLHYYRDKYDSECSNDQNAELRKSLYTRIIKDIEQYKAPGRLLDVGCGRGHFLIEAKAKGWHVTGVDPSIHSIRHARQLIQDAAVLGTLKDLNPDLRFDVITSLNVLDHLSEPWVETARMKTFLSPGGILYLRFPNGLFHSHVIKLFSKFGLSHLIQSYLIFHQYAFTPSYVRKLLSDTGFTDIYIRNSMLSGTGIYGHRPLLRAVPGAINSLLCLFFKSVETISRKRSLWGPSLLVTATN